MRIKTSYFGEKKSMIKFEEMASQLKNSDDFGNTGWCSRAAPASDERQQDWLRAVGGKSGSQLSEVKLLLTQANPRAIINGLSTDSLLFR